MSMPLLDYKPTTQNHRVRSVGSVEANEAIFYHHYCLEEATTPAQINQLIWAAYRQVFNEQETLAFNRQIPLETQLANGSITVRDFIRGLAKSERFYRLVVESNNNYRLVEICFKRLLGREPYNQDEKIAWSIKIGTLGFHGFVNALIDSDEYNQTFGDSIVPYQRQRMEKRPFSFTPRYGEDFRDRLPQPARPGQGFQPQEQPFQPFKWQEFIQQSNWAVVSGVSILTIGVLGFLLLLGLTTGSWGG